MAYTQRSSQVTGYVVTASDWNESVNNDLAGPGEAFANDGEVWIATGAGAGEAVAILNASNFLKHEYGGIELDIRAITTGGILYGIPDARVRI